MNKTRIFTLLLAAVMLLSLCSCGSESSVVQESTTDQSASSETQSVASTETTITDVPEVDDTENSDFSESVFSVEYPIPGEHTFTLATVLRMNAAEAMGNDDYSVSPAYTAMKEATGVSIDFNMLAESTYTEKMNLMMASGDLPDFFSQTVAQYDNDLMGAIEQDILIDMAPLLEENAPDYKALLDSDPTFASGVYNTDGTLSQFCGRSIARVSQGLLIRQDWLDALDMTAPTNFEELTDVLLAFKNEMGATNALLVNFECDSGLTPFFNTSFTGFRGVGYQRVEENGDELICSYASEGFIEYLTYLNELYHLGIINEDFMNTGKEYGNWESSYYSGVCGVWQDDCKYTDPAFRENGEDGWIAAAFALSDIDVHVTMAQTVAMSGKLYITSACEEPEVAMQYVNYCYTPDGTNLVSYGAENVSWERNENGNIQFTEIMTNNPDGLSFDIAAVYYTPAQWLPVDQQERYLELTLAPEAVASYQLWTAEYGDDTMTIPTDVTLTPDESLEFNNLAGDVLTAVTEAASKVVVGSMTVDDYRSLITDLDASGLGQMDEIYATAYQRYLDAQ